MTQPDTATPPILTWTQSGLFAEIAAPDWWYALLEALFPLEGDGRASYACFGAAEGQMIEVWELRPPGEGYVLSLSDGTSDQILWVPDRATYLDFITSRGAAAWLALPRAT